MLICLKLLQFTKTTTEGGDFIKGLLILAALLVVIFANINSEPSPFPERPINWSLVPDTTQIPQSPWSLATPEEVASGIYEIKEEHGGRGTHAYFKKAKE